jgi:NAD(P)H-flavin reductase
MNTKECDAKVEVRVIAFWAETVQQKKLLSKKLINVSLRNFHVQEIWIGQYIIVSAPIQYQTKSTFILDKKLIFLIFFLHLKNM